MRTTICPEATAAIVDRLHRSSRTFRIVRSRLMTLFAALAVATIAGCSSEDKSEIDGPSPDIATSDSDAEKVLTSSELRYALKANDNAQFRREGNDIVAADLSESGISDISELKGVPLRMLSLYRTDVSDLTPLLGMQLERVDLGFSKVKDISVLAGMPITELDLESSEVTDISALKGMKLEVAKFQNLKLEPGQFEVLKGMPIRELNLMGVPITDLTPFAELPVQTLWLPMTTVTDLGPLRNMQLVSLDIADTQITDLSPLAEMTSLKRLNINGSAVTDLTPLAGLTLERLTLDPGRITAGMDAMKAMKSLAQIGPPPQPFTPTSMPSAQFWPRYEVGAWEDVPEFGTESANTGTPEPDASTDNGDKPEVTTPEPTVPEPTTPESTDPEPEPEPKSTDDSSTSGETPGP